VIENKLDRYILQAAYAYELPMRRLVVKKMTWPQSHGYWPKLRRGNHDEKQGFCDFGTVEDDFFL
jgi:hypothetical protein